MKLGKHGNPELCRMDSSGVSEWMVCRGHRRNEQRQHQGIADIVKSREKTVNVPAALVELPV